MRTRPSLTALAVAACVVLAGAPGASARAADGVAAAAAAEAPLDAPPAWEAPAGVATLPPELDRAAESAARALLAESSPPEAAAAVRRLARIGPGALPHVVAALRGAPWRARASLVAAVAEMDAPQATDLLVRASRDPSFAVREAAVTGLGKTGVDAAGAAVIARTVPDAEPSWRVRATATTALRRLVLRGRTPPAAAGPALAATFADPDPDVVRAALAASGPLALAETLPHLLAAFRDSSGPASDRALALTALRAFRDPSPDLIAALRQGFLQGTEADEAVRAARALFDVRGAAMLDDAAIESGVLHHLTDEASRDMREALVSLGPAVRDWIVARTRIAAERVAAGRDEPGESPFDPLLDALFQVDEEAGIAMLRELLAGPDSGALHRETRLSALRRARFAYAARFGAEFRTLLASPAGRDVYAEALDAVAASGGGDVAALLETALRDARPDVRTAALVVVASKPSIATPPAVAEIAATSDRIRERLRALQCLAARDAAAAEAIARPLLSHPDPDLRAAAIGVLGTSKSPDTADLLRARLRDEDGRSSHAAATSDAPLPPAAATGSDSAETPDRVRRELRSAVVRALRAVAGAASHDDLMAAALRDRDARVRETAAQELRGIATPDDAVQVAGCVASESDDGVRTEMERLLATLGDAPAARAHFDRRVADADARSSALRLLAEERAQVVPDGLATALFDATWSDDERVSALRVLERHGVAIPADRLAGLARGSHTLELCAEAVRALAASSDASPEDALNRLLADEADPARRAIVVQGVGERGSARAVPALGEIVAAQRATAVRATSRAEAGAQLYREAVVALGRIGGADAMRVLVAELLHPAVAGSAAALSVDVNGPFQPEEGAAVGAVRALVAALAHDDDAALAQRIGEAVASMSRDAGDATLDPEYLDGVARYLSDPSAFDLPARRRTAAALPLWTLAARNPPRWSRLAEEAWQSAAGELEQQGRFAEAVAAFEASIASADVENATRSREERRWETGRLAALRAREAAAAGANDRAAAIADSIRAPDPASGDLAYLAGWCRVKLGLADEAAAASLRVAAARDARNANARFFLAWIAQATSGPEASLPLWAEAARIDRRRVEEMSPRDAALHRRGRPHRWGHFSYWNARALAACGRDEAAAAALEDAISLDDRFAAQAAADAAFAGIGDVAEFAAAAVRRLPHAPMR